MKRLPWIWRLGDALSQFLNVLLYNGDANESISGRSYREGWALHERVINWLFFFDPNHCEQAFLRDAKRAEEIVKMSGGSPRT